MTTRNSTVNAGWQFDNSYTELPEIFYSKASPVSVSNPKLAVLNEKLAQQLGLNIDPLRDEAGAAVFAGNSIPDGSLPIAQAYAGHQFGHFTMLGDGRAVLLGEHIDPQGNRFDIQLKGAGRTPYSRGGDGRAALGPMLREYIMSEAMHALRIPTTRSLAVATTGDPVYRETELQGAVLTRIAASHIRVGTFEFASQWGTEEQLRQLADYAIQRHYPAIQDAKDRYLSFLRSVIERQAKLIAQWQLVGFIHGVMNTDNMTISGETIDYGPCAFMDIYDPATVFSSIDREGRYAYSNQPYIGGWNLSRFAESLLPLLHSNENEAVEIAQEALSHFGEAYFDNWLGGMRAKLGLFNDEQDDETLIKELLQMMQEQRADYTNTFIALTFNTLTDAAVAQAPHFTKWHASWQNRLERQQQSREEVLERMKYHNPAIIPRNHRVEEALSAATQCGDYDVMHRLLKVLSEPYAHTKEQEEYAAPSASATPYRTFCGT